ncbi:MAG: amino acid adenylation domain-containing protein [Planctomycetota bacterium]
MTLGRANVEDVYELTPAQAGMLFHTLGSPGSGVYVQQLWWTLEGEFDAPALARAWDGVAARHAVLRTSFHWQGLERPYQVVHRSIRTPLIDEDLRALAPDAQQARLDEILEDDRQRGFDLTAAPAVRMHRYRLADRRHRIVVSYHHILLDGWSVPVVSRELLLELAAERDGRTVDLPAPRLFAEHVRAVMAMDRAAAAAHWRERLAGFVEPSLANLGGSGARAAARAGVTHVTASLDEPAAERLAAAARDVGVTIGTMALGAWAIALSALSGKTDVLFGVTSSGRDTATGANGGATVGMCLTTLPFRTDVATRAPMRDWLRELQRRQAEDRRFEHTPLAELRSFSELRTATTLFDAIVVVGNTPLGALEQAADRMTDLRVTDFGSFEKTNYPLTLLVSPRRGLDVEGLGGADTDPAAVQRAVALFVGVLDRMALGVDAPPSHVPLVDPRADGAAAAAGPAGDARVEPVADLGLGLDPVEAILAHAGPHAESIALVAGERTVSYRELGVAIEARAAQLAATGVRAGDRVAIAAEPGPELVEAILAVLRAGATCVPLDPAQPPGRRTRILANVQAAALLATPPFADQLAPEVDADGTLLGARLIDLGEPAPLTHARVPPFDGTRPAYVLHTSGSTGVPKGVVLPLDTLSRLAAWQNERSGPEACAVTLALAPIGFDVAFQELLSTLVAGGRLVLVPRDTRRDPGAILDLAQRHGVTRLFVPFVLLDAIAQIAAGREHLPASLREVVTAGEALRVTPEIRAFFGRLDGASLDNQYGPAEAHVVTAHRLTGDPANWEERPPIGHAVPGTRLDVLDRLGRPLPDGVVGELYLAGRGLAHGYLGAPATTAERFVPDPQPEGPESRRYRTGDLVRRRADGALEFVGRVDDQVKLRGYRVELGEIEAILARHPAVEAAAASVRRTTGDGAGRLIAHLVERDGAGASDAELKSHLEHELPIYMLPEAFVRIPAMPVNANGKIDRRALPAPPNESDGRGGAGIEPRTETERLVAEIWSRALERDGIGAHDDFFDLGGHSLSAVRVSAQLGAAIGREVPVVLLFERPTPAKLAAWIDAPESSGEPVEAAPVRRDLPEDRPLSEAQRRLFVLNPQCAPTHRFYHTVTARRLRGPLDVPALQNALDQVVCRHEPLRTSFAVASLTPLDVTKRVQPPGPVPLELVDLDGVAVAEQERAVRMRAEADFAAPFDLASGLLLRATLLRLAADHHVLVLVCHQLAFDAWSREVLLRELETHYRAGSTGTAERVAAEPATTELRYDDLAAHEAALLDAEPARARLESARARLAEPCPPLELVADHPRPAVKTYEGIVLPVRIPAGLTAPVRELARSSGVTLYMALLSLYVVWLHAYSGQTRLRIGSSTARRRGAAAEQMVGPFNDFLVLEVDLSGDPGFREIMRRVREVALGAHAQGDVPFARLVDALDAADDRSRTPLYQAMFTYKRFLERPEGRLGELTAEGLHVDWRTARTDVTLSLLDDGEEIVGFFEASADLFDPDRLMQRLGHAQVLLEAVARTPDAPLSSLPLAPEQALRYDRFSSLSASEQRYLDALETRHGQRTERSRSLASRHLSGWADPRFANAHGAALAGMSHPLFAERAEGAHIYDVDGNRYVDLTMSFGITLFGHRPQFLADALVAEVDRGFALGMPSPRAAEAAERLRRMAGVERVAFFGTRTEAVIVGVRACRAATARSTVVVFRGSYHGNADEMQTGPNRFEPGARPPGIPAALAGDVLVLDYCDPRALDTIEAEAARLAAVLVEPIQSQIAARLDDDPATFLAELRALTHRVDVPLVFDETVFGFRVHPAGCQGHFGIEADLAIYGKPVGGGLPIGVLGGRRAILDQIDGGAQADQNGSAATPGRIAAGSTFGGHPLSMAAACAVLAELERRGPDFQAELNQRTAALCERLNGLLRAESAPIAVTRFGSRFGLASLGGGDLGPLLRLHLLERGVYLQGDCGSLSAAHDERDLETVARALQDTVRTLAAAGFRA